MAAAITFSGLASGIDSSSLIKSLLDQERKVKIDPLQTQITDLTSTNEAFDQLTTLLTTLRDKANAFRTISGGGVSKRVSSSDDSTASATASGLAASGTYALSVSQLAKNATFSFGSTAETYTSGSSKISGGSSFTDSVTIKIGDTGSPIDTVNISVNENTTLSDFVSDFNSQTSDATASLVNVGTSSTPDYRVVINTSRTGITSGQIDVTVGATLDARNAFDSNSEDDARNAVFSIAGVASDITRESNTISDVLSGVTLNLYDTGSAHLSVALDATQSATTLRDFVEAYNEVLDYARESDLISQEQDGTEVRNIFGPLSKTTLDENIQSSLRAAFSSSSLSGGLVNTLADLGIATDRQGKLTFDEDAFNEALANDPTSAETILNNLGETLASTNGTIAQFIRFNGLIDTSEASNSSSIQNLNERISEIESQLSKYEESLLKRFSTLEVLTGKLQAAQSALAGLPQA